MARLPPKAFFTRVNKAKIVSGKSTFIIFHSQAPASAQSTQARQILGLRTLRKEEGTKPTGMDSTLKLVKAFQLPMLGL